MFVFGRIQPANKQLSNIGTFINLAKILYNNIILLSDSKLYMFLSIQVALQYIMKYESLITDLLTLLVEAGSDLTFKKSTGTKCPSPKDQHKT